MKMDWKNSRAGYGLPSVAFHWLMLALLLAVCATMELRGMFPRGSGQRTVMMSWHYMLGLTVFALVWLRLLLRSIGDHPRVDPPPPAWQAALARATQWVLYGLMIGLPVLGWLAASAKGTPVSFFGADVPPLIGKSETAGKWLKEVHETLAKTGYFVVGLHAAAALYHHYVRRDNTLRLMLLNR